MFIMNYTSIEQSKKLLELGLDPESADMCWLTKDGKTYNYVPIAMPWKDYTAKNWYLPCWSVGALIKAMPTFSTPTAFSNKVSVPTLRNYGNSFEITYEGDYQYPIVKSGETETVISLIGNTAIEAAYNMVVWLLENNFIKKGE